MLLTKEIINPAKIILLSILFLITVIYIKYKPVYTVTLAGETLGYVAEQEEIENELNKYMNNTEGTVAIIDIQTMPEYEFKLVSREEETNETEILETIEQTAVITYKTYGVTVNGEVQTQVASEEEAQEIVNNLTSEEIADEIEFELGVVEIYSSEDESIDEDTALLAVSEIKTAKVTAYEEEQAKIAAEKAAKEAAEKAAAAAKTAQSAALANASTSDTISASYGEINGITLTTPIKTSVTITSRFGEVSSSRSSAHTGLDLAVALGTPIYPIASGTVITATLQGSYGNLIIIDHGNGVQSYYAHCNSINVSVGDTVTTETMIGTVGSTGNSTGPHLHLEIRINGVAYNPQNYLY